MKQIIKLDFDEIKLAKNADKIILNEDQENALYELLKAKENIEIALEMIKEAIGRAGEKLDPSFKGIQSDKFSFMYRLYGSRFIIDPAFEDQIPEKMIEKKVVYRLKTKEVEKYFEEVGELPLGVIERDRSKKASLKLKEVKNDKE